MQVEEQKRRAEADKLAAITALEQRSREFMVEKEAKRRLEQRISSMQSQLLIGGAKVEDTPVFRWVPPDQCTCWVCSLYCIVHQERQQQQHSRFCAHEHWRLTLSSCVANITCVNVCISFAAA